MTTGLSLYLGNRPQFWLKLHTHNDRKMARRQLIAEPDECVGAHRPA
jgi:plasmid maintenance system antidote protein VapI